MRYKIEIDSNHFISQIKSLLTAHHHGETWDEFGARVETLRERNQQRTPQAEAAEPAENTQPPPHHSNWHRAKELMHAVFTGNDAEHDTIRQRVENLPQPLGPPAIPLLSLWLAGALKTSINITRPMVATILYAVSNSDENWKIIQRSLHPTPPTDETYTQP